MKNLGFYALGIFRNSSHVRKLTLLIMFVFISTAFHELMAQPEPKLSIQGILKKATGEAVDDNTYNMTFSLYTVPTGGAAIWSENQTGVEVTSGIYSTVLGNT